MRLTIKFANQDKMSLEQLKAQDIARATTWDVLEVRPGHSESQADVDQFVSDCDAYFSIFCKPSTGCVCCGRTLGGLAGALTGGFRYGIAWGEGACGCGYPGRALHVPKDKAGEKLFESPLQIILQYHPAGLEIEEHD